MKSFFKEYAPLIAFLLIALTTAYGFHLSALARDEKIQEAVVYSCGELNKVNSESNDKAEVLKSLMQLLAESEEDLGNIEEDQPRGNESDRQQANARLNEKDIRKLIVVLDILPDQDCENVKIKPLQR